MLQEGKLREKELGADPSRVRARPSLARTVQALRTIRGRRSQPLDARQLRLR